MSDNSRPHLANMFTLFCFPHGLLLLEHDWYSTWTAKGNQHFQCMNLVLLPTDFADVCRYLYIEIIYKIMHCFASLCCKKKHVHNRCLLHLLQRALISTPYNTSGVKWNTNCEPDFIIQLAELDQIPVVRESNIWGGVCNSSKVMPVVLDTHV